jgi:DNA-binding beta-propeller fold protein YncE
MRRRGLSITEYRHGEGLVEIADRDAAPQKVLGTEIFNGEKPPYRAAPPAATLLWPA